MNEYQFPAIQRLKGPGGIAVRTWVGKVQCGNVLGEAQYGSDEFNNSWLDHAEQEMFAKLCHHYPHLAPENITAAYCHQEALLRP